MANFEELQALVEVVSKNKVKHIHVIGNPDSKATKFEQFYDALASGRLKNDKEAAAFFYQASPDHAAYRKLKERLQERLLNTLFFVDVNQADFNEYNQNYYTIYKDLAAIKILIARFSKKVAIPLAEKTIRLALKFELTDLVVILAKELYSHFAAIEGNLEKFKYYSKVAKDNLEILDAEDKADYYYAHLRFFFAKSRAAKSELYQLAQKYSHELNLLGCHIQSYRFNYIAYLIHCLKFELANDYGGLLQQSQDAIKYFVKRKQQVPTTVMFSFYIRIFVCYLQQKNYSDAWKMIPKCLENTMEEVNNWFLALEYFVILSFHSNRLEEGYNFFEKAVQSSNFSKQPMYIRERWVILKTYFYYFFFVQKKLLSNSTLLKQFRLSKFLNEVPIYRQDKRGANISILILQILFLLHQKKYNAIIDRAEGLRQYTYRYLRRDDTFRSHCFIRMLLTLPECSFNKTAVLRKADKYWQQLQAMPLNVAKQSAEIEIVPYETLWGFVLEELERE